MGLAALKQAEIATSEVARLQETLLLGQKITGRDIASAVRTDIAAGLPISSRYLTVLIHKSQASCADISAALTELRAALGSRDLLDTDLFLSYAQAATVCIKSLNVRPNLTI